MPDLPHLVDQYLRRAVPAPPEDGRGTLFHQQGQMRLAPERPWMPFSAEQMMEAGRTEFVWHARFKMAPLVTGVVEDAFEAGHGRLDAKIWGFIPVAHGRGVDIDRGEAQRYLAELVWCPLAFVDNSELRFIELAEDTVRVWVFDEQTYVDLRFDEGGDLVGVRTTTRRRGEEVQPWEGRFSEHRDFGGLRAPARGEVWWEAPEGHFVYWRGEVTSLDFR